MGISYYGRAHAEGKKIRARDGLRALYCIFTTVLPRRCRRLHDRGLHAPWIGSVAGKIRLEHVWSFVQLSGKEVCRFP